jgi:glycosyltransferase involved in cell wall biosynthesis
MDQIASMLDLSVNQLRRLAPRMSAYRTLSRAQTAALVITGTVAVVCAVGNPLWFFIGINAIATTLYVVAFVYNLAWFRKLLARPGIVSVGDEEARSVPDEELPRYTVLVAAYKEADVIARTIRTLEALDYPRDRLEIKLLLESDDAATIAAVGRARPAPQFEVVVVPQAEPRTKPKACNYGLQASSGELITIFDAEDRPEPLQLRRAAVAFRRLDPAIACLQAKLHYYNADQNLITRWFSAEYVTWFSGMLPALVEMKAPIPLGGTSMHIRREVLEAVGAWDPYNVTEDADLGTRLHRLGFRTEVLDSVTYEEANSDLINWVKQRSRWYKGYLQTWLVHLRHPLKLWRQLGPVGFLGFNVVVGGTPVLRSDALHDPGQLRGGVPHAGEHQAGRSPRTAPQPSPVSRLLGDDVRRRGPGIRAAARRALGLGKDHSRAGPARGRRGPDCRRLAHCSGGLAPAAVSGRRRSPRRGLSSRPAWPSTWR